MGITIQVTGNVGTDPEIRFTGNGLALANFSLASTPRVKKNGEWEDGETVWFRVTVFGRDAETIVDTVSKGMKVLVTGSLTQSTFTDKTNNEKKSLEIRAETVAMIPYAQKKNKESEFAW
jgi:single-strand DNA-binding protein